MSPGSPTVTAWLDAVLDRHSRALTTSELLRAVRALSVRYVQRRRALGSRSPIDSAGKRAAFAGFYAPLHLLTTQGILGQLPPPWLADLDLVVDLGCGTGVVGAAIARAATGRARVLGVDLHPWVLAEAAWNWQQLGVRGRTRRADLVATAAALAADQTVTARRCLVAAGWATNELDAEARQRLLDALDRLASRGARLLVIEPVGRAAVPWWPAWVDRLGPPDGCDDRWALEPALPDRLAALDAHAGFARSVLSARSLRRPC